MSGFLHSNILHLAHEHDVEVWTCQNCTDDVYGEAIESERIIRVNRPINDEASYLVALHELGHHAGTHSWGSLKLDQEASAWLWAIDQSIIRLRPEDWQVILESLESYARDRRFKQTQLFTDLLYDVRARV